MTRRRVLVVYASNHGQTEKIAARLSDILAESGLGVTMVKARELPSAVPLHAYEAVIVGASVHFNRHQRAIEQFVRRNAAALNRMPSAFFSVSGAAAGHDAGDRVAAARYMEQFLAETGWHPNRSIAVAGAVRYTHYNPILRWVMRRISAKAGHSTDTSRDHEYTDWTQVQQFGEALAMLVAAPASTG
jgi:menaquinone-dependent protoporphyrinogen oxidase